MTDTPRPADAAPSATDAAADGTPDRLPPAAEDALAQVRSALAGTLMERMGIDVVEASPARVVGTMPVLGNTQPYGLLHGGASVVLAETLGSFGAMLHAGPARRAVGIEVGASHHRSATDGVVTGTATALHLGRTTAVYEIVVEDSRSRRVCTARLTCLVIARRPD